jgi:hypothetical protein
MYLIGNNRDCEACKLLVANIAKSTGESMNVEEIFLCMLLAHPAFLLAYRYPN